MNNYIFISERELFNRNSNSQKYNSKFRYGKKIRNINKLNIGDYIVHNTHGIGKYLGLSVLTKNGLKKAKKRELGENGENSGENKTLFPACFSGTLKILLERTFTPFFCC